MSEVMIPTWIVPEEEVQELLDEGSSVFRAAFAPGLAQRQSYGGLRLKLSRGHTVRLDEKAHLLAALRASRGSYNAVRTKVHFALRGSFPAVEVLSNTTFANGTTGWTAGSDYALTSADRMLRGTRSAVISSSVVANPSAAVACTQYAPYAARWMVLPGRGSYSAGMSVDIGATSSGFEYLVGSTFTNFGLRTEVVVPYSSTISTRLTDLSYAGQFPGDYVTVPYVSLARCALVDGGANAFLQSDSLGTTWTQTAVSITSDTTTAPNGTSNADAIVENSANTSHFLSQTATKAAVAQDWTAFGLFKRGSGTRDIRLSVGHNGANGAVCTFDLGAGTAGAVTNAGTVTNGRAFIRALGDGWYYCSVVARLTTSTSAYVEALLVNGGSTSYLGNGTSSVYAIRVGGAQSSVPTRGTQTTGSASASGTSQTGSAFHLKGLPASTNGLLLPDDIFEINGEIKTCTSALNSDAAGLGYLQFEPPLVRAAVDNDAVIVLNPIGKFLVSGIKINNEFGTQARVAYDLEHIYE